MSTVPALIEGTGDLARFDPKLTKDKNAQATAVIEYAQRMRNWPTLEHAVEVKIEEQAEFVRWWRDKVRRAGGDHSRPSALMIVDDAEKLTEISQQQVSKWAKRLGDRNAYREKLYGAAWRAAMGAESIHFSSETPEHYTPKNILDAVLACMGEIDLDPCGNVGEPNVPAHIHFTQEDDGLAQAWHGRVFINPPYGTVIGDWVRKLHVEHSEGRATQAIALVPARTDTEWFRVLRDYPVCFVAGRLTFVGNTDPAPFPSAVFYLGEHVESFTAAFENLGDIWKRIR